MASGLADFSIRPKLAITQLTTMATIMFCILVGSMSLATPNTASTGQVTPVPPNQVSKSDNLAPSK